MRDRSGPAAGGDRGGDLPATEGLVLGVARLGIGAVLLAAPALMPRLLGADRRTAERVGYLGRMVGIREAALGVGTLDALWAGRRFGDPGGRRLAGWVAAQALSDAGDAAAVAVALRRRQVHGPLGVAVVAAGVAGAVADLVLLRRMRARARG